MTREELKAHCKRQIEGREMWAKHRGEEPSGKVYEEHKFILELLEQESYDKYIKEIDHLRKYISKLETQIMEQQLCEDAISRQAVLDQTYLWSKDEFLRVTNPFDYLRKRINSLSPVTPQPKWIPVSERLPEDNGWYQCTVISDNLSLIMDLFYKSGKWLDNRRIDMYNIYDIYGYGFIPEKHKLSYQELISDFDWTKNVVAWMPLPQPYKGESEEN